MSFPPAGQSQRASVPARRIRLSPSDATRPRAQQPCRHIEKFSAGTFHRFPPCVAAQCALGCIDGKSAGQAIKQALKADPPHGATIGRRPERRLCVGHELRVLPRQEAFVGTRPDQPFAGFAVEVEVPEVKDARDEEVDLLCVGPADQPVSPRRCKPQDLRWSMKNPMVWKDERGRVGGWLSTFRLPMPHTWWSSVSNNSPSASDSPWV
jgi:hypothetical protein